MNGLGFSRLFRHLDVVRGTPELAHLSRTVLAYPEELRVFIFTEPLDGTRAFTQKEIDALIASPILDLPFPVCGFEIEVMDTILNILVKENTPGDYTFFNFVPRESGLEFFDGNGGSKGMLYRVVLELLEKLRDAKMTVGVEHTTPKIKTRDENGEKVFIRPSPFLYVRARSNPEPKPTTGVMGTPIDWSCSWDVSSHWRRVPGVGKDRLGQYVVEGLTWVKPYRKGDGPLVSKIRVVK